MARGRWFPAGELARRLDAVERRHQQIERQVAAVLRSGWRDAAMALCDSASPAATSAVRPVVTSALQSAVADQIRDAGLEQVRAEVDMVRRACPTADLLSESKLHRVAEELWAAGRTGEAMALLAANVEWFPRSFLAPYWLAERQLLQGDTAAAVVNYRRSVANDPAMLDAIERLRVLGAWR
jgi:TolA-binding protein